MKNTWKRLLAAALCLFLLIPLAGCDALDEMRKDQAFIQDDGTILWNGNVYKLLPENKYFQPMITGERSLSLTEKDVPVLLSGTFALTYMGIDEAETLIHVYGEQPYYCRADQYDALSARLSEPFAVEELCFQYGYYDYEEDKYIEGFHTLTSAQAQAVEEVLAKVTPWKLGESGAHISGWTMMIQESSKDHLMRRNRAQLVVEGLSAYLTVEMGTETYVYTIPDNLRPIFIEMSNLYDNVW